MNVLVLFTLILGVSSARISQYKAPTTRHSEHRELLLRDGEGFCYISLAGRWVNKGSECNLEVRDGYWSLWHYTSNVDGFYCGVTCVQLQNTRLMDPTTYRGIQRTLLSVQDDAWKGNQNLCYFTYGRELPTSGQSMKIDNWGGGWMFQYLSDRTNTGAGFVCVRPGAKITKIQASVGFPGGGSAADKRVVSSDPEDVCILNYITRTGANSGTCEVVYDGQMWTLEKTSGDIGCMAKCVTLENVYTSIVASWNAESGSIFGGDFSRSLSFGSSRSDGHSLTQSWSSSLSTSIKTSAKFGGTGVEFGLSASVSESLAQQFSSSMTVSMSKSVTHSCPAMAGMYVRMFSYQMDAKHGGGVDKLADDAFRCHYSTRDNVPFPECPAGYCGEGDALCTYERCDPAFRNSTMLK